MLGGYPRVSVLWIDSILDDLLNTPGFDFPCCGIFIFGILIILTEI